MSEVEAAECKERLPGSRLTSWTTIAYGCCCRYDPNGFERKKSLMEKMKLESEALATPAASNPVADSGESSSDSSGEE